VAGAGSGWAALQKAAPPNARCCLIAQQLAGMVMVHVQMHPPTHPPTGVLGGFSPVNFQLVIDRPERVSRVMPPTTTSTNTQPLQMPSHTASCLRCPGVRPAVRAAGP
jgi:hypothetical protein